jgi:DNA polymerase III sliding clamp (beta) subunit (PCNA family)
VTIRFSQFDEDKLVNVPGFAARIAQVAWAVDSEVIPYTGIHIDGKHLIATDRYRVATVPLDVPVDEPITVPLSVLTDVAKNAADARLAVVDNGSGPSLHVMPTDHAQVTATIYDIPYPDVQGRFDLFKTHHDQSFKVNRELLMKAINRMLVLVKSERYPRMKLTIGQKRLHILINVEDVGEMEDEVSVLEGADHPDCVITFTPNYFLDGMSHAGTQDVTMHYVANDKNEVPVLFDDGKGYNSWIVPRRGA